MLVSARALESKGVTMRPISESAEPLPIPLVEPTRILCSVL